MVTRCVCSHCVLYFPSILDPLLQQSLDNTKQTGVCSIEGNTRHSGSEPSVAPFDHDYTYMTYFHTL